MKLSPAHDELPVAFSMSFTCYIVFPRNMTLSIELQSAKAFCPMLVTPEGIVRFVRLEQPLNAPEEMARTDCGISIDSRLEQP